MKKTRIISALIPLIGLMSVLFVSTSVTAQGPETFKGLCTEEWLDQWFEDDFGPVSGPCDPNSPPDISAGITNEYGNTTQNYPNGLCYASFNNYTDMIDNRFLEQFGVEIGMDPYGSNPPLFKDERNFFKVRKWDESAQWADYQDVVEVEEGDKLTFMIYIHNDGDSCFNDNVEINRVIYDEDGNVVESIELSDEELKDKFYGEWNTTSHNTRVGVSPFFTEKDGKFIKTLDENIDFKARIISSDALTAEGNTGYIENVARVKPNGNENLFLELIDSKSFYVDYTPSWDWEQHEMPDVTKMISETMGAQLSTLTNGNIKGSNGDYYASEPYIGLIIYTVEVKTPEPNICLSLQAEVEDATITIQNSSGAVIEEKAGYKLSIPENSFIFSEGEIPEDAYIRWESQDLNGKFYYSQPYSTSEIPGTSVLQSRYDILYYVGEGPITVNVEGLPADEIGANCHDLIEFEPIIPPVCEELKVNYPSEIRVGTVSSLSAMAYEDFANGVMFDDTVTFWVENQEGIFYYADEKPEGLIANPADMVFEFLYLTFLPEISGTQTITETLNTTVNTDVEIQYFNYNMLQNDTFQAVDMSRFDPPISGPIEPLIAPTLPAAEEAQEDEEFTNLTEIVIPNYENPNFRDTEVFMEDMNEYFNNYTLKRTITANPGQTVYFLAQKPGTIKIQSTHAENCSRSLPIIGVKELPPVCESIIVDKPAEILEGYVSEFRARSLNDDGYDFGQPITYSIDSGFGCIFTEMPTEYSVNPLAVQDNGASYPRLSAAALQFFYELNETPDLTYQILTTPSFSLIEPNTSSTFINPGYLYNDVLRLDDLGTTIQNRGDLTTIDLEKFDTGSTENESSVNSRATNIGPIDLEKDESIRTMADDIDTSILERGRGGSLNLNPNISQGFPTAPLEPIICPISATVNPGESVYIWASKESAGKDVIHVNTVGTENESCEADYPIEEVEIVMPPICNYSTITAYNFTDYTTSDNPKPVDCLADKAYVLETNHFYETISSTEEISPDRVTVKWESTDPDGIFIEEEYIRSAIMGNLKFGKGEYIGTARVVYVSKGGGDITTTLLAIDGISVGADTTCTAEIKSCEQPPEKLICEDLTVLDHGKPLTTLQAGKIYKLSSTATYSDTIENPRSAYTSREGVFVPTIQNPPPMFRIIPIETIQESDLQKLLDKGKITRDNWEETAAATGLQFSQKVKIADGSDVYFIPFPDASGTNAITVQADGRKEKECIKSFDIIEVVPGECQSITVLYGEVENNWPNSEFDPTTDTFISVREGYFGDFQGTFKFEAKDKDGNLARGTFKPTRVPEGEGSAGVTLPANPRNFSLSFAEAGVIYSGGVEGDVIYITAEGELAGTQCNFMIRSDISEVLKCVDLNITFPEGTWTESDFTDDDEQRFKIEVDTNPAGYASNLEYIWDIDRGDADWKYNQTDNSDSNPLVNYLENIGINQTVRVEIWAQDASTHEKFYNEDGNQICIDTKTLDRDEDDEDEEPEIEKSVYSTRKNSWRGLINISGKEDRRDRFINTDDEFITYKVEYDPGSAKSTEIWEAEMDDGRIDSANLNGYIQYSGIVIAIENNGDQKIVYRSADFDEDYYDNEEINGDKLTEFEDWDEFNDRDDGEDFYNDEYECGSSNGKFCLENDFDDIEDDFQEGSDQDALKFKNSNKVDKIYIIYQFTNHTIIDEEECKDLRASQGCGERFDNEINFKGYKDNDFDDKEWDGQDDARVIVICPFVLSRQSGDTLFHSELDTGVSVEYCSQVDDTTGTTTQPTPPDRQTTPRTGGGDTEGEVTIEAPSHDICKLSNTGDVDLEEYSNVFKNFSSSVCEMQADVAEAWTQNYIVSAINANIEKISRWGTQTGNITIAGMTDVESSFSDNAGSGVFVVEGNLTISNTSGAFTIKGTNTLPAAQTYIVKGGTLTIESNISYDDSSVDVSDPGSFPIAAFIVIDGNIEISNDVTEIDGILMAVDTEDQGNGQIMSLEDEITYENALSITGSLIGDVNNLFSNRKASGDPAKDEGSITVHYDQRILLNTPPGLSELIDVSQLRVAE